MKNKVIVLVLGYKSIKYLDECIVSLTKQTYKNFEIWFGDNNSNDGSIGYLNKNFPKVKTFQFKENGGYAGGNNKLIKKAFENEADFCLVLNADTKSDQNLICELVNSYEESSENNKVGLIQPLVMLYDKPEKINSAGNVIHYLGFGYCGGYMSDKIPKNDKEIISVSGTAMLIPREYYESVGLFDEEFFMYNEDQDYSWRGLMMGYKHFVSVKSKIWHKYSFSKNENKWYHSEKNRLMMLFKNYEKKTLLKLIPIIIFNEVAMLVYSLFDGWFFKKIKSYVFLFKNKAIIKRNRKENQKNRMVGDKQFLQLFNSELDFEFMNNFVIKTVINPIYKIYRNLI